MPVYCWADVVSHGWYSAGPAAVDPINSTFGQSLVPGDAVEQVWI